ncbi:MAG: hypothetical protein FWB86_06525 [Treponema sp.]|nr:hypothetical protein [Treponema sp.]MCL2250873.1 hypothetical protein [Treponema sp.]
MRKGKLIIFVLALMLAFGFVLSSCSTDFWDGFVDGYNSTRYSYDSGYIFDRDASLNNY